MSFLRTLKGDYLSLNIIREAEIGSDSVTLFLDTGATRVVSREEWFQGMANDSFTAFPALPGTYRIHAQLNGDKVDVFREPVIGWAVKLSGKISTICATAMMELDHVFAVMHPDGSIQDFQTYYDNYDLWLEDMNQTLRGINPWDTDAEKGSIH